MAGNLRARLERMRKLASSQAASGAADGAVDGAAEGANGDGLPDGRVTLYSADGSEEGSIDGDEAPAVFKSWAILEEGFRYRETTLPWPTIQPSRLIRLAAFGRRLSPAAVPATGLAFFDLETTGLSGGSGTVAFLAAIGQLDADGGFRVRQYFIDDYPAEIAFVARVVDELRSAEAIVTYNGASFDMPLLATRCSMNRIPPLIGALHVDALHAARRLWKRPLGGCSLSALEAAILGVARIGDIPGAEVPEAWFDYVKRGRVGRLARVFDHNDQDVRSLAGLFFLIDDMASGGSPAVPYDMVGLAEIVSRVDEAAAERALVSALDSGDDRATRPLMRLLRTQGRRYERAALVPSLPDDAAGLLTKSVYAERVLGDIPGAIDMAARAAALARDGGSLRARAEKRLARLEMLASAPRKIG